MKSLKQFAQDKSNFISLKDGEKFSGIYKGYKFIEKESFGETKEYVRYLIQHPDTDRILYLDSQSASLAKRMDSVQKEDLITIRREGEGMKTKYVIESPTSEGSVADTELGETEEGDEEIPILNE